MKRSKTVKRQPRIPTPNTPKTAVFSYHGQRSEPASKAKAKGFKAFSSSRRFMSLWHWAIVLFGLITLGLVIRLDSTPKLVLGQNTNSSVGRPLDTYQKAAEAIIKDSFRNRTKLTFDASGFSKQMKTQFPEIEDLEVRVPLLGRLPVVVVKSVKQPAIILQNSTDSYIVDETGRTLLSTKDAPSSVTDKLITINDQSGLKLEPGLQVIPVGTVRFIRGVQAQLAAKQVTIRAIDLPAAAQEAHFHIAGQGYYVKCATDGDPRLQVGTFLAVKQRLEKEKTMPKEYIDVRVEEKAFYR